jgi:hypothetical protein
MDGGIAKTLFPALVTRAVQPPELVTHIDLRKSWIAKAAHPTDVGISVGEATMRRRYITGLMLGAGLASGRAGAQTFPSKQITLVVPFAAGGPTDTLARILAERMGRTLGQTVIVDNTTGAAGTIGVARVVRAAPDGYTIGIGHWSTHVVNPAIYPLPFNILDDLEPLAYIATNPQLLVSRKDLPAADLKGCASFPTEEAARRCRTWSPARSTSCSTRPPIRSPKSRRARSRRSR